MGLKCYYVAEELKSLTDLVISSDVDVHARCDRMLLGSIVAPSTSVSPSISTKGELTILYGTVFGGSDHQISTASDLLLNAVVSLIPKRCPSPMPLYPIVSDILLETDSESISKLKFADPGGTNLRVTTESLPFRL